MRTALISDLHANLVAFEAVLRDAREQGAEKIVCLGDVVGYGPLPRETLVRTREVAAVVLAGNHDDAVSGRINPDRFIDLAADAAERHRLALKADELRWLATRPHVFACDDFTAAHGDLTDPPRFHYVDSEDVARANFAATEAQLVFVGHTHVPGIFLTGQSGRIYRLPPQDFTCEDGKRYIVNPGSVGYPREADGRCLSTYVLYDSTSRSVVFRALPFAVSSVLQRGRSPRIWGQSLSRFKRTLICTAIGALLAVTALTAYLVRTRVTVVSRPVTVVERPVTVADDPALVVHTRQLALPEGAFRLVPNLRLARASAPVTLRITFRDAERKTVHVEPIAVRQSSRKRVRIPPEARTAELKLLKARAEDAVAVEAFEPRAFTSEAGRSR